VFYNAVFNRMDYGESGEINFEEYVFSLWDFLTNDLHHFVFQVFGTFHSLSCFEFSRYDLSGVLRRCTDKDDSNYLNHKDMEQLMLCSYGVQFDGIKLRIFVFWQLFFSLMLYVTMNISRTSQCQGRSDDAKAIAQDSNECS
jgi:hypothetical protein